MLVKELFFSASWTTLHQIFSIKILYFKVFGNMFKGAVESLNAAKNRVLSASNLSGHGTVRKRDYMSPNLCLGKPHFGKSCRFTRRLYTR